MGIPNQEARARILQVAAFFESKMSRACFLKVKAAAKTRVHHVGIEFAILVMEKRS